MKLLNLDKVIKVRRQQLMVSEVIDSLISLPSSEVKTFFELNGLTLPKAARISVLQKVLKDPVEATLNERAHLADELGYRLTWVEFFSEYQLENLLKFYNSVSLNRKYLSELWLHLLSLIIDKKIDDKELLALMEKAKEHKQLPEDMLAYNLDLKDIFVDEKDTIDGVSLDQFRTVLYKASTVNEIREIGKKYQVNVPKRLKKEQLADIVVGVLKDRNELTPEVEEEVRSLSIVLLQRFAKDRDIKASIELKKEEVIEFILANAEHTKENYSLPQDPAVYDRELRSAEKLEARARQIEEAKKEEPTPAPVIVKEEPKVVAPKPVKVEEKVVVTEKPKHSPQYEEVVRELELLRKELLDHINNCKCTKAQQEEQKN